MSNTSASVPDYFALFQSMFNPPGANAAATQSVNAMYAMLDPKELERKISEMETVLTWLKTTTGMVEVSIQAMKYQQDLLKSLSSDKSKVDATAAAPGMNMDDLAKLAGNMNPALWAFNMMQNPAVPLDTKSTPASTAAKKPKPRR